MQVLTRRRLQSIVGTPHNGSSMVSIFMPTHRAGSDTRENPIRFKNMVSEAEERLEANGADKRDIETLLKPLRGLIEDYDFWQNQDEGLAVYAQDGMFEAYLLPADLPEKVRVSDRFAIKPLVPMLSESSRFFVLALSGNDTRLLRCTAHTQRKEEVEGMPDSMADALWADNPERQIQFRTVGNLGAALFHGAWSNDPDVKDEYLRYFRAVDDALTPYLNEFGHPLVLACVDYLAPIYREANTYGNLIEGNVGGNPDRIQDDEVREDAWQIVEPLANEARDQDLERFGNLLGTGKTSTDPGEIVIAGLDGRIDTLFIDPFATSWGKADAGSRVVEVHGEEQPGDEDLIDLAAAHALSTDARIHALPDQDLVRESGIAAIFRY